MIRIRIARKRKKVKKYAICPDCRKKTACKGMPGQKTKIKCHICGKKFVVVFSKGKKKKLEKLEIKSQVPEKITLGKIIWILSLFFITVTILSLFFIAPTSDINIETLFISILIGIMLSKELADEFIPNHLKKKVNIIMAGFIIIFLLIVANKIIDLIFI
jgi:ribosomal protein S27E